jgi:hypothetical protein
MHNGFLYGVGADDVFLKSAKMSASSIKDYYPDAHITLCAPERMVDHQCREIFDRIITGPNVPDSARTKLWALSKTPYDTTMYMDADTMCVSEDIKECFDQLKDNDMLFTLIRKYNSNPRGFVHDVDYKYHGGVFLYNRKSIPLMTEWWDSWSRGQTEWNYPYTVNYRVWDQFYLYYLLKYTDHGLKVGVFEDDARWNYVVGYLEFELAGKPAIIRHCTIDQDRKNIL